MSSYPHDSLQVPPGPPRTPSPKLGAYHDDPDDEYIPPLASTKPTSAVQRCWGVVYENRGLLFLLVSQFFGSLMNVIARILSTGLLGNQKFHALQILFVRQSITTAGCLLWMWFNSIKPLGDPKIRILLLVRGLAGFFGVFGLYYSLTYLDLSDATVITFLAPIVASYACSIIPALKEPFTRTEASAAFISLLGVILIARPQSLFSHGDNGDTSAIIPPTPEIKLRRALPQINITPRQRLIAVLVALLGVLGAATAFTTIRWIGKRAHPLITVFYFSAWCAVVSFVSLLTIPSIGGIIWPADSFEWGLLVGIGICGFIMQFLLTAGLQREKAGRGTNMVYTQMLFALAWERIVWGSVPKWESLLGGGMILGSAVWVGVRKEKVKVVKRGGDEERLMEEEGEGGGGQEDERRS
ncbi:hypothetical protein EX30DRAFT_304792 [Ascodesmis nigricans]|uniref:EamA domain-containing protein n=1 Tax=Ascodesmis nigricans TaxID=341454 RepID=A0A4S2N2D6_9PEZI|nr:hypothetical protein EX30DRAFT_304792 [Ascodesmis nigricans]